VSCHVRIKLGEVRVIDGSRDKQSGKYDSGAMNRDRHYCLVADFGVFGREEWS
jgi:hypothetical protein